MKNFCSTNSEKALLRSITVESLRHKESLAVNDMWEDLLKDQDIYNEIFSTILSIFLGSFLFHRYSDKSVLCFGNEYRTILIDSLPYNNSINLRIYTRYF